MIKEAQISEMPALLSISQRSFEPAWSVASFAAEFNKPYSHVYIYEEQNQPVAYLIIWVLQNEGEIVSLAVDKGWRNKGIGSMLLKYVFKLYDKVKKWSLEVDPKNLSACNLYEKNDFQKVKLIKDYYGQGKDAILMTREPCSYT